MGEGGGGGGGGEVKSTRKEEGEEKEKTHWSQSQQTILKMQLHLLQSVIRSKPPERRRNEALVLKPNTDSLGLRIFSNVCICGMFPELSTQMKNKRFSSVTLP